MFCPRCQSRLSHDQSSGSNHWECPGCQGMVINLRLLRGFGDKETVQQVWQNSETGPQSVVGCPACQQRMKAVHVPLEQGENFLELDVCRQCQFIWFDGAEYPSFPRRPSVGMTDLERSHAAREAAALWEVERIRERAVEANPDRHGWQTLAGVIGLPIEADAPELKRRPWVTWMTALAVVIVSCLVFWQGKEWVRWLAFIPAEPWRMGGLTFLTSFFVHGGIFHLLSNLYFLLIFGDNVEDLIGRWRYLGVLVGATVTGDVLHWMFDARSTTPLVGASGGISGIIALYALAFPQAKLGMMFRFGYAYFRWFTFSARAAFTLWLVMQLVTAWLQISGQSRVSALAHLGGCLVGVLFWLVVLRERPSR